MPLYEYQCSQCGKIHEIIQKFSDSPLTECPECKGAMSKLMSMNSFALRGAGWYTTDYKKKPSDSAGSSGGSSGGSSSGSSGGSSSGSSGGSGGKAD